MRGTFASPRRGRPDSRRWRAACRASSVPAMKTPDTFLGLDLGGTRLKAARVRTPDVVESFTSEPANSEAGLEGPLAAIERMVASSGGEVATCVGLGSPGVIDPATGALVGTTPHVPWPADFPLRETLVHRLRRPVRVDNDANLAALAESLVGAGRGARVSLTVTIGTGVGSGIVVNGRLLRGAHGGAGEIGHLPLGSDGPPCRCGVPGCAEPLVGGAGITVRARECGLDAGDARDVFGLAAAGEPRAVAIVATAGERLAAMIACALHIVQPDCVIVGGGVATAGEALMAPLRAGLDRLAMPSHRRGLRVVPAMLGERAGAIGAALLAMGAGV